MAGSVFVAPEGADTAEMQTCPRPEPRIFSVAKLAILRQNCKGPNDKFKYGSCVFEGANRDCVSFFSLSLYI